MPRPLLSGTGSEPVGRPVQRVAGVYAPAFVERMAMSSISLRARMCRWGLCPGLC